MNITNKNWGYKLNRSNQIQIKQSAFEIRDPVDNLEKYIIQFQYHGLETDHITWKFIDETRNNTEKEIKRVGKGTIVIYKIKTLEEYLVLFTEFDHNYEWAEEYRMDMKSFEYQICSKSLYEYMKEKHHEFGLLKEVIN
jgi:hypothetical protein|tara:strand:+ start:2565 stop:2981 length:417 start_codon:yes stop_codon:yes gene_type:complete